METERITVLLLPGQGAQREQMAAGLYGRDERFTAALDTFLGLLPEAGAPVRDNWLRPQPNPALDDALLAQPLLFGVGYALGQAVRPWFERRPSILLGHSVGELAAACLAGVFTLRQAAELMASRSAVLAGAAPGGMLGVAAAADEVMAYCGDGVAVGAVNGPRQTVLAGPEAPLARAAERLAGAGFTVRRLRSDHAFHSPSMAQAAVRHTGALAGAALRPPRLALHSTRTARAVADWEAVRPEFWGGQLALPVLYWPALKALLDRHGQDPGLILLDASADRSLTAPAQRHRAVRGGSSTVVPLLPDPRGEGFGKAAEDYASAVASRPSTWAMSAAGVPSRSSSPSSMVTG